jgi:hypothetical protein
MLNKSESGLEIQSTKDYQELYKHYPKARNPLKGCDFNVYVDPNWSYIRTYIIRGYSAT